MYVCMSTYACMYRLLQRVVNYSSEVMESHLSDMQTQGFILTSGIEPEVYLSIIYTYL